MNRVERCFLSFALGDALGAPLRGLKDGHIAQLFGRVDGFVDVREAFPDRPGKWCLPGLYTAVTQQAMGMAELVLLYGEVKPRELASFYLRLRDEGDGRASFGAWRGVDFSFRRALALAEHSARDPRTCGQAVPSALPVAAVVAVALFYRSDWESLRSCVLENTLLVNRDPRTLCACVAFARAVFLLLEDAGRTGEEIAGDIVLAVAEAEDLLEERYLTFLRPAGVCVEQEGELSVFLGRLHCLSGALKALAPLLRERDMLLGRKTILAVVNDCDPPERVAQPQADFAPACLLSALYCGLSADTFQKGMEAVLNAGGATHVAGALTGALLGARFEEDGIPVEWLSDLIGQEDIRARGRALYERQIDWAVWEDGVELEKALTGMEQDALAESEDAHAGAIEKSRRKKAERRERHSSPSAWTDRGFAPAPEVWLDEEERAWRDPVEAKKERARRGRKRIDWKEARREKKRLKKQADAE